MLNFDNTLLANLDLYEYIIVTQIHPKYKYLEQTNKIIKLKPSDKQFGKLKDFVCVGKYYYSDQNQDYNQGHEKDFDDNEFM